MSTSMSRSRSVHVKSITSLQAAYRAPVFVSVFDKQKRVASAFFAVESSGDSDQSLFGYENVLRLLLALGKRLELHGEFTLRLTARDQMPDGYGGFEDANFELYEYFEAGVPLLNEGCELCFQAC